MRRFDGLVMIAPRTEAELEFVQRVGTYCRVDGIEVYRTDRGPVTLVKVRQLRADGASMLMPLESIAHAVSSIVCTWEVIQPHEWDLLTGAQIQARAFYEGAKL